MNTKTTMILVVVVLWSVTFSALAQQNEPSVMERIKWQKGPSIGRLGDIAEVRIPAEYVFADAHDTRLLMEVMHNPTSGTELGFIAPAMADWFLVFEFENTGYVKDDEKNSLDADAMLNTIQKGNEAANRARAKRGWAPLNITGWEQPPRYNPATHNLEWAITAESEGSPVINWNTRLLGRKGVMKVTLVTDPKILNETLPHYQTLVGGYSYSSGHRYAEFRQGDKMAQYGLSALVVGGATAVAAKTGMLKSLWKVLVVGFLAAIALLRKLFTGKKEERLQSTQHE
jgi:uncharacterized membrane-anchored protein